MSVTISGLPAASTLTGAEQVPVVQSSATKRTTTQDIADLAGVNVSNATGVLAIVHGGTGQTSANAALNALLPTQTGQAGKFLSTDGSNTSWATAGGSSTAVVVYSRSTTVVNVNSGTPTTVFSYTYTANEFVAGQTLRFTSLFNIDSADAGTDIQFGFLFSPFGGTVTDLLTLPAAVDTNANGFMGYALYLTVQLITASSMVIGWTISYSNPESPISESIYSNGLLTTGFNFGNPGTLSIQVQRTGSCDTTLIHRSTTLESLPA